MKQSFKTGFFQVMGMVVGVFAVVLVLFVGLFFIWQGVRATAKPPPPSPDLRWPGR